jgi:hypothetical protein
MDMLREERIETPVEGHVDWARAVSMAKLAELCLSRFILMTDRADHAVVHAAGARRAR